jgi:hypothetical protein
VNVGDLVRPTTGSMRYEEENLGVVIAPCGTFVVVFWNDKYPAEVEDKDYLKVINENR